MSCVSSARPKSPSFNDRIPFARFTTCQYFNADPSVPIPSRFTALYRYCILLTRLFYNLLLPFDHQLAINHQRSPLLSWLIQCPIALAFHWLITSNQLSVLHLLTQGVKVCRRIYYWPGLWHLRAEADYFQSDSVSLTRHQLIAVYHNSWQRLIDTIIIFGHEEGIEVNRSQ